jgi:hypothetical protein
MLSTPLSFRKALLSLVIGPLIAATGFAQSAAPQAGKKPSTTKNLSPVPVAPTLQLEPKALELLKATSDKLRNAHSLSFTAVELFEQLTRQDAPLGYTAKYEVTLQRPDKLRVLKPADGNATSFYYDGKSMMGYSPAENLLAVADAPPTIDATLEKAYQLAGIYVSFDDVIVANPYGDLASGLKHAYYVGQSQVVGGTTTDIVAYAGDGVFVQLWVGADDKLPRLMRAIFLDDPDHLRHELAFTDWKLDETVPADSFRPPAAASTAKRIPFAAAHPEPPASGKAPAKVQPTKVKP